MAARNFTGSAGIRSSKNKPVSQNLAAELAILATRIEDIRAAVSAAVETLRGQNVRIDADVAAALERRASIPLTEITRDLGKLAALPG